MLIWGDTGCNGLPKDTGGKNNHLSCKEKEKPTSAGSVDQIGPEVMEHSEDVRIDSGKTAVLSKDGTGSIDKSELEVELRQKKEVHEERE